MGITTPLASPLSYRYILTRRAQPRHVNNRTPIIIINKNQA
jgi:hypothetical protein